MFIDYMSGMLLLLVALYVANFVISWPLTLLQLGLQRVAGDRAAAVPSGVMQLGLCSFLGALLGLHAYSYASRVGGAWPWLYTTAGFVYLCVYLGSHGANLQKRAVEVFPLWDQEVRNAAYFGALVGFWSGAILFLVAVNAPLWVLVIPGVDWLTHIVVGMAEWLGSWGVVRFAVAIVAGLVALALLMYGGVAALMIGCGAVLSIRRLFGNRRTVEPATP